MLPTRKRATNEHLFRVLSSVKAKTPDLLDIFNREALSDISESFSVLVRSDYETLRRFLDQRTCLDIINESYNYVELPGYGALECTDFIKMC